MEKEKLEKTLIRLKKWINNHLYEISMLEEQVRLVEERILLSEKFKEMNMAPLAYGDAYYYLSSRGFVKQATWEDWQADFDRLSFHNVYLTESAALTVRDTRRKP